MTQPRSTTVEASSALVPALVLFGGITLILIALLASRSTPAPEKSAASVSTIQEFGGPTATPQPIVVAQALDPARVAAGGNIFSSTCTACHGFNAMGIPGLGKTLIGSEFVNGLADEELVDFIRKGRDIIDPLNTTGVMMPAKGGNPTLDDEGILNVVFYIRSLNTGGASSVAMAPTSAAPAGTPAPTREPVEFTPLNLGALPAPTSIAVEPTTAAVEPASSDLTGASESIIGIGRDAYNQNCAGCHGANGEGVTMVAQPLNVSQLLNERNGMGLFMFLTTLAQVSDSQTAYPHPERGGNLALTDDDMLAIIGYLYSLPGQ